MPNKHVDPNSGAVIYTLTPQERKEKEKERQLYDLTKEVKALKKLVLDLVCADNPKLRYDIVNKYFNTEEI